MKITMMMTQMRTDEILYVEKEVDEINIVNFVTDDGISFESLDDCTFSFLIGGVELFDAINERMRVKNGLSHEEVTYTLQEDADAFTGFGEAQVLLKEVDYTADKY